VSRIEAVTFDYWQTLMFEEPGHLSGLRRAAWSRILSDAGIDVPDPALRDAFDGSWAIYEANWIGGTQYLATDAANDVITRLGLDLDAGTHAALVDAMVHAGSDGDLRPAPGIGVALRSLRAAGVRTGIVCDVGMTGSPILLAHLQRGGLLSWFDHWSFSDVVGHYKPAPEIFRHALHGLGVHDPARVAHVGDRLRTDVAGALGMGMIAVRYTGLYDDPEEGFSEAHHVLDSHDELPGALGLAPLAP
jgi:FMN phosphatase YigB (HAD superfamily)